MTSDDRKWMEFLPSGQFSVMCAADRTWFAMDGRSSVDWSAVGAKDRTACDCGGTTWERAKVALPSGLPATIVRATPPELCECQLAWGYE
jgi:hypothetical protein